MQPLSGHTNTEVKKRSQSFARRGCCASVDREPIVVCICRHAAKEESAEEIDVTILEVYGRNWGQEHRVSIYSFDDIVVATDNFSDANMLGKGGFGKVYKVLVATVFLP